MAFASDKIMFEIYREEGYGRRYRVVYFTELDEHNKESEISAAMAGEHFFDGFLKSTEGEQAKQVIGDFLRRLNAGEPITASQVDEALQPYTP